MKAVDFFRRADWLDRARVRGYLRLVAVLHLGVLGFYLATSHHGLDRNGVLLGSDFVSFWSAGQMLTHHANVYDTAAHIAVQKAYYPTGTGYAAFFYPPTFLLFCAPFGYLSYFPALGLWLAATVVAYGLTIRAWFKTLAIDLNPWLAVAAFSPVLITMVNGQTSLLISALLGMGVLLVERRPWLAGVLFGLAAIKPQFGLLIPPVLLVTREWRTILAATASASLLALLSTLAFGTRVWSAWLGASTRAGDALTAGSIGFAKMQSPYAALRLIGADPAIAYAVQALITMTLAGILVWLGWGKRFDTRLGSAMLAAAVLATPFALDYDLALLAFPIIILGATGTRAWERFAALLGCTIGLYARTLGLALGIPFAPLVVVLIFVLLVVRLHAERKVLQVT